MTAKYSTGEDDSTTTTWREQNRAILHSWTAKPFQGHRHKYETVECRLVVEFEPGVGADILLEARSEDTDKFSDDWSAVKTLEIRDHELRHTRQPEARWVE